MSWDCETRVVKGLAGNLALLTLLAWGAPAPAQESTSPAERAKVLAARCQRQPEDAGVCYEWGAALVAAREYNEATEAFLLTASRQRAAGDVDPRTYNALGWARLLAGDTAMAERDFLDALKGADERLVRKVHTNLGVLYVKKGDYGSARQSLTLAAELGSTVAGHELEKLDRLEASLNKR